ncbi:MAG: acetyl-CoA C-acetyltransferase [Desulforhopalus sp.]|jgi:acetyl-CoA C-acetyltransferase|nr:acetyl-CoA C-acetyltransferase [Desulforhopalus sp.]
MRKVVIVSGVRTPVGAYGGTLQEVPVVDLGAVVLKECLNRVGLRPVTSPEIHGFAPSAIAADGVIPLEQQYHDYDASRSALQVDQVIMGNVVGAGQGQNVARQAMIRAGIPKETTATSINKLCASGMEAVVLATQAIRCGDADTILAGGMENMSRIPYALPSARWGQRMNDGKLVDLLIQDGLHEVFYGYHMGNTAENIAERYGITRAEQDEIGALSHARAMAAIAAGAFSEEIVPVTVPGRKGTTTIFDTDERPMATSAEKMGKLRPAFQKEGTVTAGNASGINDAAAALLIMAEDKALELGLKPLAVIQSYASAGLDPAYMGLGPIPAVRRLLSRTNYKVSDFDRIELNEAFAAQAIACLRELDLDLAKTNTLGSGISIGHPIGCTGARILVTLMHQLLRENLQLGLASLCIGGGQGMAMVIERY